MAPISRNEINLYEEAKAGLSSLVQQTATVLIGLVLMLLVSGGTPTSFVIALSFCIGTAFVAWSEQKRVVNLRSSNNKLSLDSQAISSLSVSITNQTITLNSTLFRISSIACVSEYRIKQGFAKPEQYGIAVETVSGHRYSFMIGDKASADKFLMEILEVINAEVARTSDSERLQEPVLGTSEFQER